MNRRRGSLPNIAHFIFFLAVSYSFANDGLGNWLAICTIKRKDNFIKNEVFPFLVTGIMVKLCGYKPA